MKYELDRFNILTISGLNIHTVCTPKQRESNWRLHLWEPTFHIKLHFDFIIITYKVYKEYNPIMSLLYLHRYDKTIEDNWLVLIKSALHTVAKLIALKALVFNLKENLPLSMCSNGTTIIRIVIYALCDTPWSMLITLDNIISTIESANLTKR